jgi:hypothetical protein
MGRSFIEDGAATAFIGSTDLALYNITKIWRDERDGGAFSLDYYFFQFFIGDNQKCGEALSNSKNYFYDNFWFTNESYYEWIWRCYSTIFGFTLYGDPALNLIYKKKDVSKNDINHFSMNHFSAGKPGIEYAFFSSTVDPFNLDLYYLFDWGDGNNSDWIDPYSSGDEYSASYIWLERGIYDIKVKAKNTDGSESEWSNPLALRMPKKNDLYNNLLLNILEPFRHRFTFIKLFFNNLEVYL